MKKAAASSVGAGVEVAVAEAVDAVAPAARAVSDPALELIEEIYREQASRFRRVAAAIVVNGALSRRRRGRLDRRLTEWLEARGDHADELRPEDGSLRALVASLPER